MALRMAQLAIAQRDEARGMTNFIANKYSELATKDTNVTIKKIEEPDIDTGTAPENISSETGGSVENGDGLEVPQSEVLGV